MHLSPRLRTLLGLAALLGACSDAAKDSETNAGADAGRDAGPDDSPRASPGCKNGALASGMQTVTLAHDGVERSYLVYVPASYDPKKPAPLVLNYHGLTSNATQQLAFSGANGSADEHGFVVAYPEGLGMSFNAGVCCSALGNPPHTADDAGFTRAIIDDLAADGCIDLRRVYSTGMSNGGYMSEYNACVNAGVFAAVAPVSAVGMTQPTCEPSRPIAMIAFNGTADNLVNYDRAVETLDAWVERNGCKGKPAREDFGESYCERWTDCEDGVETVRCTATGMGHCWPGMDFCPFGDTNLELDANALSWEFLSRFVLPN